MLPRQLLRAKPGCWHCPCTTCDRDCSCIRFGLSSSSLCETSRRVLSWVCRPRDQQQLASVQVWDGVELQNGTVWCPAGFVAVGYYAAASAEGIVYFDVSPEPRLCSGWGLACCMCAKPSGVVSSISAACAVDAASCAPNLHVGHSDIRLRCQHAGACFCSPLPPLLSL